jgi:hypothetical protein
MQITSVSAYASTSQAGPAIDQANPDSNRPPDRDFKSIWPGHGARARVRTWCAAVAALVLISGACGAREAKVADDDSPCGPYVAAIYCQGRAVLTFEQFLELFPDNDAHDYARYAASPGQWLRDDNVSQ